MNIFEGVNKEHILKAKAKIDLEGVPDKFHGRDYAVNIEGKEYPFKYLLSIAYTEANGKTIKMEDFGSSEANRKKFEKLYNFKILSVNTLSSNNVTTNTISINDLIRNYKDLMISEKYNEIYKWEVVKHFQENWNANATDFADMLSKSLQPEGCNLWVGNQYYPRKMITSLANKYSEDVRGMFNNLYNEDLDLGERVNNFARSAERLLELAEPDRKLSTYQDKRAIMVYLTLMYPDKYYLYKNRMFNDFCEITGMKERPGMSKKGDAKILIDFFELCSEVKQELIKDKDLIERHLKRLDFNKDYKEKEYNLLTQDFIYCATTYLKTEPNTVNEKPIIMNKEQNTIKTDDALNVILYGPPGTGKTYNTIDKALEIASPVFYKSNINSRKELIKEFKRLQFDPITEKGQIAFITFHQSMSYEDFVEGIKPIITDSKEKQIQYEVKDGIFKMLCEIATKNREYEVTIGNEKTELTRELFEEFYYDFSKNLIDQNEKEANCKLQTINKYDFNLFKNSVGSIVVKAGKMQTPGVVSSKELVKVLFENKSPTYESYEDIIINKILEGKSFTKNETDNYKNKYVIIIDEINRGNISQIFGELITLIEKDKRINEKADSEELKAILPYSKKSFGVPCNIYIIGTMNSADRSVEALDTALRRRFSFVEMAPDPEVIGKVNGNTTIDGINIVNIFNKLNERIEKLLDRDHLIGHSYFLNIKTLSDLKLSFANNIIPLLQEYFYGDYGKIGLILGNGFISVDESNKNIFAKFADNNDLTELLEKKIFRIVSAVDMNDEKFKEALTQLLN